MRPWARSFLSNAHVPLVRCACFVGPLRPIITFYLRNLLGVYILIKLISEKKYVYLDQIVRKDMFQKQRRS